MWKAPSLAKWLFAILVPLALVLAGCEPRWLVVTQAQPNPFVNKTKYAAVAVSFDNVRVGKKTMEQYIADMKDDDKASFAADRKAMNEEFLSSLVAAGERRGLAVEKDGTAEFVVKASVYFLEPGFYAVVASKPSEVRMEVKLTDRDGKVLDAFKISVKVDTQNFGNVSSGARFRQCAGLLGTLVAEYIDRRTVDEK
ncbi:MAG: hypothetical protein U0271_36255 [Polyangiaceae bacterium]